MRSRLAPLVLLAACAAPTPASDASVARDATSIDAASSPDAATLDAGGAPLVRNTDFTEATGEVRNPERGMYWLDWMESSPLVLVEFSLADQCDVATLPTSVLDALRAQLAHHRDGGRRVILRFLYANDGVLNRCGLADATSVDIVVGHVAQLAPVLVENQDVIAVLQAGLFGMWGEWNQQYAPAGTSLDTSEANRDRLLNALLDALPSRRAVDVRRPRFRDELAAPADRAARIGFHDDCFLASADDEGTYDGARSIDEWKTYVGTMSLTAPAGAETCLDDPTYTSCANALVEIARLRLTYVHEGYHPDVIARWTSEGCLEEIRRRLGYRLVVRAVEAPASIATGDTLRVHVELENVGFAPPYEHRRVQIRLRDGAGGIHDVGAPIDIDTTGWLPTETHALDVSAAMPAVPAGTYELRLFLMEDASDLPAYAMLFANDDRVRDDARRENVIASIDVR